MEYQGKTAEKFLLQTISTGHTAVLQEVNPNELTFLWLLQDGNELTIDTVPFSLSRNTMICLTPQNRVVVKQLPSARIIRFNRPFYCIIDHDKEVGCKGILFFGASRVPVFEIPENEIRKFELLYEVLELEMANQDSLQLEMLQLMLKRLIILCTRLYKNTLRLNQLDLTDTDIIREYNFLVEQHFREKHQVTDYAEMLHKSPKTLANLFAKLGAKTPLEFIQDRKLLEARRLLRYTDKGIKEIAWELGYDDLRAFGRFFKKGAGHTPTSFRESGSLATSSGIGA